MGGRALNTYIFEWREQAREGKGKNDETCCAGGFQEKTFAGSRKGGTCERHRRKMVGD